MPWPMTQSMAERSTCIHDPPVPAFDDRHPVAGMDAECAVRSWGARMIHRLDRSRTMRICPIQCPLGAALLRHYVMVAGNPSSWLFPGACGGAALCRPHRQRHLLRRDHLSGCRGEGRCARSGLCMIFASILASSARAAPCDAM